MNKKTLGLAVVCVILATGAWLYQNNLSRVGQASNGGRFKSSECEGRQIPIPFENKVPWEGMEWAYSVENQGLDSQQTFSEISYRFMQLQPDGERWLTHIIFGSDEAISTVFEVFAEDRIAMHPPRQRAYQILEKAPFPAFKPGVEDFHNQIVLGTGWEPDVGLVVERHYTITSGHQVTVPVGEFNDVWLVSGKTPGWKGEFWWREDLGFIKMKYASYEGQEVQLSLKSACLIE